MGVRLTERSNVALYDSVTGLPLSTPVFESELDAEDFLGWLGTEHPEVDGDPRRMDEDELNLAREAWEKMREAERQGDEAARLIEITHEY